MLYRLVLVACRTFITEPVRQLYPMSALVLTIATVNAITRPYKDQRANITATLSYIANLCIAVLNLVKAHLVAFGCDTNCSFRDTVAQYKDSFENVLFMYASIVATSIWFIYTIVQKILPNRKKNSQMLSKDGDFTDAWLLTGTRVLSPIIFHVLLGGTPGTACVWREGCGRCGHCVSCSHAGELSSTYIILRIIFTWDSFIFLYLSI